MDGDGQRVRLAIELHLGHDALDEIAGIEGIRLHEVVEWLECALRCPGRDVGVEVVGDIETVAARHLGELALGVRVGDAPYLDRILAGIEGVDNLLNRLAFPPGPEIRKLDGHLVLRRGERNAGRAEAYRDAASKSGVTPAAAGQAAAQQLVGRIPAGQYYKPLDGGWTRK